MTKKAMKLAIDALDEIEWSNNSQCQSDRAKVAIIALREALAEQPAQQWQSTADKCELQKVPANGSLLPARQEPVAWMCKRDDGHFDVLTDQTCKKCFPVYTTPLQRTWVGLTDVEWMNIVNKDQAWLGQRPDEVAHEVAKLVEAKLRSKNT